MRETMKPDTLYGVMSFDEKIGDFEAETWAELRAGQGRTGRMQGRRHDEQIIWFFDPGARDEFRRIFGGVPVTLNRKPTPSDMARNEIMKSMRGFREGRN